MIDLFQYAFYVAQAGAVATLAAGAGAVPVPAVGLVVDLVLIRATVKAYCKQLGLTNRTSEELDLLDTKYKDIIQRYESIISAKELSLNATSKEYAVMVGVEQISKFIPIVGSFIASTAVFVFTLRYLLSAISELEEAALAVWDNATKRSVQND